MLKSTREKVRETSNNLCLQALLRGKYLLLGCLYFKAKTVIKADNTKKKDNWVAVRRTYAFTLQEVEKICRTL